MKKYLLLLPIFVLSCLSAWAQPASQASFGPPQYQNVVPSYGIRSNDTAETGSTTTVINATAHALVVGDMVVFGATTVNRGGVGWVTSTGVNSFAIYPPLPTAPNNGDFFYIVRPQPAFIDQAGQALTRLKDQPGNDLDKAANTAFSSGTSRGLQILFRMATGLLSDSVTASSNNAVGLALMDVDNRQFANVDGSGPGSTGTSCSSAATNTADTQIKAGVGSQRIYVRSLSCKNESAVPSGILFKDGSTTVWVGWVGPNTGDAGFVQPSMFPPLRGSVNTAFNFAMVTTSTSTICCANWYVSGN